MASISQHMKEKLKHNENIEKYIIMRDRTSLHHSTVRKSKRKKGEKKEGGIYQTSNTRKYLSHNIYAERAH